MNKRKQIYISILSFICCVLVAIGITLHLRHKKAALPVIIKKTMNARKETPQVVDTVKKVKKIKKIDYNISGTLRDTEGKGVANVIVSDGYKCVKTDSLGRYKMKRDSLARFIYYSVPADCEVPTHSATDRTAYFYQTVSKKKAEGVTAWLVPGSWLVDKQIREEGIDKIVEAAGFEIRQPGCSACLAMNDDKIPAGKYSVVSAMRGAVQMISYEMSLGLCLISAVVLTGTMQVSGIVEAQTGAWNWLIIKGHVPAILAFLVFLVAGNAEANRGPFDLAEAESELTAGYHTEYSGMGFGFYYLAEYLNLFVISGIASTVFLGGWAPLNIGIEGFDNLMNLIPGFIWFFGKTFAVVWLLMWVRWTFPRLRIDQILKLEWKYLMPLSLVILILMTVCVAFGFHG